MNVERQRRALAIFQEICDLPAEQRSTLLEQQCGQDSGLRRAVQKLLAHDEKPHEFVDAAAAGRAAELVGVETVVAAAAAPPVDAPLPPKVGHYAILRRIGEGGMGTVYEARQENPRRTVALKVIRPGVASYQLLRRFQREAQVLGQLGHPGIAQIYEAGMHEDREGLLGPVGGHVPFFAMELIRGRSIDQYAKDAGLTLRSRFELLAKVCDAVHYAHLRGVIHRDLKPGNILVDEFGQPKILDFGVARAIGSDVQATMQTDVGQLVGTLAYMSPEQVAGQPELLDVRSDVYALGVMLYELAAGKAPYDIRGHTIPEAARIIREDEPSRLSSLDSQFRGDVENIVAKALEKDRDRRYASAAELAADIRRYLADEPILARPASTFYQLRKFARRNKGLVAGLAAAILVLVAGVITSTALAMREARQRRLAETKTLEAERLAYAASVAAAAAAISQGDLARAQIDLERAPPALRGWEWKHLHRSSNLSRATFAESAGWTEWADLSRDETTFVTVGQAGAVNVLDMRSRQVRERLRVAPRRSLTDCRLSPDGSLLLMNHDERGVFEVLDLATGEQLWERENSGARLGDFTPDGTGVVLGGPRAATLTVHDARTGRVLREIAHDSSTVPKWIVCDPDGRRIFADFWIIDLATDARRRLDPSYTWYPSPDWSRLVQIRSGNLQTESIADGRVLASRPWAGHRWWPTQIEWFAEGAGLVVFNASGLVEILDSSLETVASLRLPQGLRFQRLMDDQRTILTCSKLGRIQLWDLFDSAAAAIPHPPGFVGVSAAVAPDGRRVAVGDWGHVRVHDSSSGAALWCTALPRGMNTAIAYRRDGKQIAVGDGFHDVRVLDAKDGRVLAQGAFGELPLALRWLSEGSQFVIGGDAGRLAVYDAANLATPLRQLSGHASPVTCLALSPDGRRLASGSGDGVSFPQVGSQATTAGDSSIRLWRVDPWECERRIPCDYAVTGVVFSPDGDRLAAATLDGTVTIYDSQTAERVAQWPTGQRCGALAYHPGGRRLVVPGEDGVVRVWDVVDRYQVAALPGPLGGHALAAAYTPDGATLVASNSLVAAARFESAPDAFDPAERFFLCWAYRRMSTPALATAGELADALHADTSIPASVRDAGLQSLGVLGDNVGRLVSEAITLIRQRADQGPGGVKRAAQLAARAREVLPDDAGAAFVQSLALYYLDRFSEALIASEACLKLSRASGKSTAGPLALSALAHSRLGHVEEAQRIWAGCRESALPLRSSSLELRDIVSEAELRLDRSADSAPAEARGD